MRFGLIVATLLATGAAAHADRLDLSGFPVVSSACVTDLQLVKTGEVIDLERTRLDRPTMLFLDAAMTRATQEILAQVHVSPTALTTKVTLSLIKPPVGSSLTAVAQVTSSVPVTTGAGPWLEKTYTLAMRGGDPQLLTVRQADGMGDFTYLVCEGY